MRPDPRLQRLQARLGQGRRIGLGVQPEVSEERDRHRDRKDERACQAGRSGIQKADGGRMLRGGERKYERERRGAAHPIGEPREHRRECVEDQDAGRPRLCGIFAGVEEHGFRHAVIVGV